MRNMSLGSAILLGVAVSSPLIIRAFTQKSSTQKWAEYQQDRTEALYAGAAEIARIADEQAPIQLDESIRLVGADASSATVTYRYAVATAKPFDWPGSSPLLKEQIVQSTCADRSTVKALEAGLRLNFAYRSDQGDDIGVIEIKDADCGVGFEARQEQQALFHSAIANIVSDTEQE